MSAWIDMAREYTPDPDYLGGSAGTSEAVRAVWVAIYRAPNGQVLPHLCLIDSNPVALSRQVVASGHVSMYTCAHYYHLATYEEFPDHDWNDWLPNEDEED